MTGGPMTNCAEAAQSLTNSGADLGLRAPKVVPPIRLCRVFFRGTLCRNLVDC